MPVTKDLRGREIIVNVGQAEDDPTSGKKKKRRGSIPPGKKKKGPTRRRRAATGIRMFDLGQRRLGDAWEDIVFTWINSPLPDFPGPFGGNAGDIPAGAFAARDADIFTVDRAQWKNQYRKITPALCNTNDEISTFSHTGVSITLNSENVLELTTGEFTSDGIIVFEDDPPFISFLMDNKYFQSTFETTGPGVSGTKVTSIYDFAASPVVWTPTKTFDIYFLPHFAQFSGTDDAAAFYLNYFYRSLSRDKYREHKDLGDPQHVGFTTNGGPFDSATVAYFRSLPGARSINALTSGISGPGDFNGGSNAFSGPGGVIVGLGAGLNPGSLIAVINQGSAWFYIWADF